MVAAISTHFLEVGYSFYTARVVPARPPRPPPTSDPRARPPADPGEPAAYRPPGQDAGEWESPRSGAHWMGCAPPHRCGAVVRSAAQLNFSVMSVEEEIIGCRVPGAGCRVPGAGCRVPGALRGRARPALGRWPCATDDGEGAQLIDVMRFGLHRAAEDPPGVQAGDAAFDRCPCRGQGPVDGLLGGG
ncbi:hypothetical protein Shyhy01_17490 [Streptomyces hygroscopicus subsp. hygroscopicus]|nr:hypothetical protein Shyhy01_17490 [Streptomyces hygroscopicus subsp. hygroscopicus]